MVSIYEVLTAGTFVKKVHESSFILMWIIFALVVLMGPAFCGRVCPTGALQEWFGKIGKKILKERFNTIFPHKFDRYLMYLRYLVPGWVLYTTVATGKLIFEKYGPHLPNDMM